jgi:imidazoleglycerol-phosphate dehydratase
MKIETGFPLSTAGAVAEFGWPGKGYPFFYLWEGGDRAPATPVAGKNNGGIVKRKAELERRTQETTIKVAIDLDGKGRTDIATGIPFFDHMLTLFSVHGFLDLTLRARGDIEVDSHHTVEDVGIVLGDALEEALGDRKGIRRYGFAVTPMDEALASVAVDLSRRAYLVYQVPSCDPAERSFNRSLAKEFFKSVAHHGGMNLHVTVPYGENEHHILEAAFKSFGRALGQAVGLDARITGVRSSKGML